MIDLYTWPTPNGRKVSIALEELAIPYTAHAVDITRGRQHESAFTTISPNHKIPAIVDTDNDMKLMESGAILMYLARKAGRLLPAEGDDDYWLVMEWLMWQMGGVGPMFGQVHHFVRHNKGVSEYGEQRYLNEARRLYEVLDARLADEQYVAGNYSIADIAIWPWVSRYEWQTIDLHEYPEVLRWYRELASRPAVIKGYHQPMYVNDVPMPS